MTTDAELDALVARMKRIATLGIAHSDMEFCDKAAAALTALREENRTLGQLLAHVHLHFTNDENFDPDELEADMRALGEGRWIDTETMLQNERRENDRLRADLDAARKVVEEMLDDIKRMVVTQAQLRALKDDRTQDAARHEAECNVAQYATQIRAKMRALTPEKPDAE